jgi:hypothetical protein
MAASDSGKADLHDAIDRATDTLADANTPEASREDLVAVGEAHAILNGRNRSMRPYATCGSDTAISLSRRRGFWTSSPCSQAHR